MLQLKRARKLAGLTVEQLAYKAGISQHHVSRLEHGHHVPLWTTLQKLATALGVRPEELTDQAAPPPQDQQEEG